MTDATISLLRSSAMAVANSGIEWRKLVVPSSGIDDPAVLAVGAGDLAAFLHEECVGRAGLAAAR